MTWARQLEGGGSVGLSPDPEDTEGRLRLAVWEPDGGGAEVVLTQEELAALAEQAQARVEPPIP